MVEKRDAEAFESAHSVILAMFTHKKSLAIDVSAWYTDLLLDSYPERLTISQLRLAYASMVGCLTELAPGNVGPCISKLLQVIEHHPAGPSSVSSTDIPLAEISHSSSGGAPPSDTPQTAAKSLEIAALHSTRGHLLLVLIDQLSAVHLDMMERLLPKIRELLHEERKAPREARIALIQVLFNTLSGAMDMIKRESAAKWWLEHRAEIQEDENREDLKPIADTMKTSTPVVQAKM